jgi:hypothetical protein
MIIHQGRTLSGDQVAIAAVLFEAISNYSEDAYCAGWFMGIEHELWERIVRRVPDGYDLSVKKLYAIAGKEQTDWGKPGEEFLRGLEILAKQYAVWVFFDKDQTVIHLTDWEPIHEDWHKCRVKERPSLDEVWRHIHEPFPRLRNTELVSIPPMPKLR